MVTVYYTIINPACNGVMAYTQTKAQFRNAATYQASPSPGLEITPIQSESADSSGSMNTETDPPPLAGPIETSQNELHSCPYDGRYLRKICIPA